jgi:hypothetical protein
VLTYLRKDHVRHYTLIMSRLFPVLATLTIAAGQNTGTIFGTVTDQSGAVVAGVKIELVDIDRRITTEEVSQENGEYVFTPVRVGSYEIRASKTGFATVIRSNLSLEVQQRMRVDLKLQLGAVGQSVEVQAESPLLETGTSSVGQVVGNKSIVELPLNGRDYQQLAVMTSGTVPTGQTSRGPSDFSANGARPLSNNYLLDGMDNNSYILDLQNASSESMAPSIDALQEFKVQNNSFGAEFGRYGGAVINATIKSGTNRFHGDLFEFLRNSDLDANNFFNNRAGVKKAPFRQNQFGGTFGGPFIKNKLFFFGSYQGTRVAQGVTYVSTVPTAAERSGVFPLPIYDPATLSGSTRSLFPNNTIPSSRFDPTGMTTLDTYPLPNQPGAANNYILNPPNHFTGDQYDNRVDYNVSSRDLLFARYSLTESDLLSPGGLPAPASGQPAAGEIPITAHSGVLSETHTFSPTITNEFHGGVNRLDAVRLPENRQNLIQQFGFKGIPNYSDITGLPAIGVTGFTSLGENGTLPNVKLSQVFQYSDAINIIHGPHSFKGGADIRFIQSDAFTPSSTRGSFTFSGVFTQNPQSRPNTGSALADFLLGEPASATMTTPTVGAFRQRYYGFFFQDDWQVSQKLTLNLGVRWDLDSPFWDHLNRMSNFVFQPGAPNFGTLVLAGSQGESIRDRALIQFTKDNVVPRAGLAYRVTPKVVIRAAYGMFNGGTTLAGINGRLSYNPPWTASYSYTSDQVNPTFTLATGFPASALVASVNQINRALTPWDPKMTNGYLEQWNVGVEDQLTPNMLLTVLYSGSEGHHLEDGRNINQPPPGPGATQPRSPFPLYTTITLIESQTNSSYNSLQAKLERRFSGGLTFLANYTWSHFIDNAEPVLDTSGAGIQNNYNLAGERGNSNYDVRQRFVTSAAYELPVGPGKRFLPNGWASKVLGGWQLNGIVAAQSGNPFTPTYSVNVANVTGSTQRPDRISSGVIPYGQRSVSAWFSVNAFAAPAPYTFGDSGRNILTGPRLFQADLSLFKMVTFRENLRLQFRTEFFNIFNHPDFAVPNAAIGTAAAGTISSLVGNSTLAAQPVGQPRQIQFALKLFF